MLKHSDLTRRRLHAFLETQLVAAISEHVCCLSIEFNDGDHRDEIEARAGNWTPISSGFRYGPAYRSFWFRLTGKLPDSALDRPLALVAELGGERTLWHDNTPIAGLDIQHSDFGWLQGDRISQRLRFATNDTVEFVIEATTRNPQQAVTGTEPKREALVETVDKAEIVAVNEPLQQLAYDFEFAIKLLDTIPESDPAHLNIVRVLNAIINQWANHQDISRARKAIKDILGALNGEIGHSVFAIGHSHLDTAWLWPIEVTKRKMAHTTAIQLDLMDRYPEYTFAHSQASQYEWLQREYPTLFARVKAAIARGQWEPVGSMWVEADCNLTGGESLVRQFLYGRKYFRETFGMQTEDMWLPDVFGYSAALPQILAKFNIGYFLTQKMSWSQFNKFPHHTFWWQGIDGTRVWAHFPPADTYNGSAEPNEILHSVRNYKDHGRADQSLYLFGFGDGGGGPTQKHIEFLRRGRLAPNYPDIVTGRRAIDFFREAKSRSKDLLTWVGELYLELHRGTFTSQAHNKQQNRTCEFLMRDAELLASFAPSFPHEYPQSQIEAAWKLVLLNQFHDIIPGSSVREVYEDSDRDYVAVNQVGEQIVTDALKQIAGAFQTSTFARPVALFHNATMVTQGEIPWPAGTVPAAFVCGEDVVPVQLVEEFGERKLILPVPHGALGSVAVGDLVDVASPPKTRLKSSSSNRRIENGDMVVRFDPNGNIVSIQSLEDGTEFVEPGKLANVFQLFDDQPLFWSAWDIDAFALETGQDLLKSESFEIVERGPVRVAAEVVKRFGNSRIRQRISLGPTPGIRFETEIDWHESNKLLKVAFPVNINAARATYEIQFGNVERPTHMNTSWDMAKFEVCAQKWADLSEGDQGVAIVNNGKYGHDIQGNVMRLSLLRSPKAPDPLCDMGRHRFAYAVVPHYGPYNYASIVQAAYAFNAPMRHAFLDHHAGESANLPPFVICEDRNIIIETVKKAEVGDDLVVRLYECHNSRGRAELICARPFSAAMLCDLEENEIAELESGDNSVTFEYKPFEIITIKLRP